MSEERDEGRRVEILPPERQQSSSGAPDVQDSLALPPTVPEMPVGAALRRRIQYWGLTRTLKTYRRAIEEAEKARRAMVRAYEADRELEQERERWRHREKYRKGAAVEADIYLQEQWNRLARAQQEGRAATFEAELGQARLKAVGDEVEIEAEQRRARRKRAQREAMEEEQKLEELSQRSPKSSFKEKLRALEQARRDHEELMALKQQDIERYGGEENLPEHLRQLYHNFEDELGFEE